MKIAVAGAGYVGLSTAVMLSQHYPVVIVDAISEEIEKINNKISPIKDEYIERYMSERRLDLSATEDEEMAFRDADYIIVATPTNYDQNTNYFDTKAVDSTIERIIEINPNAVIIIFSTVPVGYTKEIINKTGNKRIFVSPEFLRESDSLYDNLYPSRIIVGLDKKNSELRQKAVVFIHMIKRCALKEDIDVIFMEPTEAEAVKLFANTYLAMRVSFFNELDTYAEMHSLDTKDIISGMGLDPRIGDHYNNPSFGYGGYWLPSDTKQNLANYRGIPQNMISAIVESNQTRKEFVAERILTKAKDIAGDKKTITVGVYRLTMKADSESFCQSAVYGVMKALEENGADIVIYEPILCDRNEFEGYSVEANYDSFKEKCDIVIANRYEPPLENIIEKVYTRDVFFRD